MTLQAPEPGTVLVPAPPPIGLYGFDRPLPQPNPRLFTPPDKCNALLLKPGQRLEDCLPLMPLDQPRSKQGQRRIVRAKPPVDDKYTVETIKQSKEPKQTSRLIEKCYFLGPYCHPPGRYLANPERGSTDEVIIRSDQRQWHVEPYITIQTIKTGKTTEEVIKEIK